MLISELGHRSRVPTDTIRYYEKRGLIKPSKRTEAGYRIYGAQAQRRLLWIQRAKAMGFTLDEIGSLLNLSEADDAVAGPIRAMILSKIQEYQERIAEAEEALKVLEPLARECPGGQTPTKECPIMRYLQAKDEGP